MMEKEKPKIKKLLCDKGCFTGIITVTITRKEFSTNTNITKCDECGFQYMEVSELKHLNQLTPTKE